VSLRWLYQAKADPINTSGENITPDKWIPVCPAQHMIRKAALLAAIIAGSYFAPDTSALPTAALNSASYSYTKRFQYQGLAEPFTAALSAPPADIPLTKYFFQQIVQPIWPIRGLERWRQARYCLDPTSPEILDPTYNNLGKWWQPTNQPVRVPLKLLQVGWSVATAVETPDIYQWQQPISQPIPPRNNPFWQGQWAFGNEKWITGALEITQLDKWWTRSNEPIRIRAKLVQEGWISFDPHQIQRIVIEWYQPISQPVLPRIRIREGFPGPEWIQPVLPAPAVTVDMWYARPLDPRWDRKRSQYLYPSFVSDAWLNHVPSEVVTLDKWWKEIVQPVYRLRRTKEGWSGPDWQQPILPPKVITLDMWRPQLPDIIWKTARSLFRYTDIPLSLDWVSLPVAEAISLTLPAYWSGGYFGIDQPQVVKMMRSGQLLTDQTGFRIKCKAVDYDRSTLRNPLVIEFKKIDDAYIAINRKTRLLSYEIQFPDTDGDANVMELSNSYIPISER
jgi:hypothetical protein